MQLHHGPAGQDLGAAALSIELLIEGGIVTLGWMAVLRALNVAG
jgi:hypothetical protein